MQFGTVRLVLTLIVAYGPQKYGNFSHSFLTILGPHAYSVAPPMLQIQAFFHSEMKFNKFLNMPGTNPLDGRRVPKLRFLTVFFKKNEIFLWPVGP